MKFLLSLLINIAIILPIQLLIKDVINIEYPFFYIGFSLYSIVNFIIILTVAINATVIFKRASYNIKDVSKRYIWIFLINIFILLFYDIFSFRIISPFFSFVFALSSFIGSLYLHEETIYCDKDNNWLVPYIIWTFYLALVSMTVFVMNQ